MLAFIRYTQGLGNSAIYVRLRNSSGQYWDFVGLAWSASETANCKISLTENDDSDTTESLYYAVISVPSGGPYIQEAVLASTSRVLGAEITPADPVPSENTNDYKRLFSLIESQRGTHTGRGNIYYWDPVNGNDVNNGLSPSTAKLTWTGVNALVSAYNHDVVIAMPGDNNTATVIDAVITLDKAYTFLRGPGRDFKIKPTASTNDTVTISAPGCEMSGFIVETATSGNRDAVKITADFAKLNYIWIDYSRGHGIAVENGSNNDLNYIIVQDAAQGGSGHGISIKSTNGVSKRNFLRNIKVLSNLGDGIVLGGANTIHNYIVSGDIGSVIAHNTNYGVNEIDGADYNFIVGPGIMIDNNTLGNVHLTGAHSKDLNVTQFGTQDNLLSVKAKTDTINWDDVSGILGLSLENKYEHSIIRDSRGCKTSSIIEIYDTAVNANLHDGITGLIGKYQVTATYSNGLMTTFLSVRV